MYALRRIKINKYHIIFLKEPSINHNVTIGVNVFNRVNTLFITSI